MLLGVQRQGGSNRPSPRPLRPGPSDSSSLRPGRRSPQNPTFRGCLCGGAPGRDLVSSPQVYLGSQYISNPPDRPRHKTRSEDAKAGRESANLIAGTKEVWRMDLRERVDGSREELLGELNEFLRMPSISARENGDFRNCARWVAGKLEDAGAEASIMETEGYPVVYAEVGSGESTLLSYGHYDVQPPEPLELWESDPFEPTIRGGGLYARGVADDKGDVLARIHALRLYTEEHGSLPFKLKFLIEGEEEVGSPNLAPFVRSHTELLRADACLWEGSMKDEAGRPMIFFGTKGMAYVELRASGASHDVHSMYGG